MVPCSCSEEFFKWMQEEKPDRRKYAWMCLEHGRVMLEVDRGFAMQRIPLLRPEPRTLHSVRHGAWDPWKGNDGSAH